MTIVEGLISLSKALKYKKRVEERISELSSEIADGNSILKESERESDISALLTERDNVVKHLVDLKVAIMAANQPIQRNILVLAELKGKIAVLKKMSTVHGPGERSWQDTNRDEYVAVLRKADVQKMVKEMEVRIDDIQDELDAFNATTKIKVANFGCIHRTLWPATGGRKNGRT